MKIILGYSVLPSNSFVFLVLNVTSTLKPPQPLTQ